MLSSHTGLAAITLGRADISHFYHHRMFHWTVLLQTMWTGEEGLSPEKYVGQIRVSSDK